MLEFRTNPESHRSRLSAWEDRVDNMNTFEIDEDFPSANAVGKYDRFISFVKDWMSSILTSEYDYRNSIDEAEFAIGYYVSKNDADGNRYILDENWWNLALKAGNGHKVKEGLPQLPKLPKDPMQPDSKEEISQVDKNAVYDALLPAYRAIKESFDKRSVFQWIFNHAQYTAERDALKALRGVITTLTGDTKETLDQALVVHQQQIPTSDANDLNAFFETGAHFSDKEIEKQRISIAEEDIEPHERSISIEQVSSEKSKQSSFDDSMYL